jgi:hypothetical protein
MSNMNFICKVTIIIPLLPGKFIVANAVIWINEQFNSVSTNYANLFDLMMCSFNRNWFHIELITKKWNWFPNIDPINWSFTTTSRNSRSDLIGTVHLALQHLMMWWRRCSFSKCVQSFKIVYCTCLFHLGPLDFNLFDSFLNCSIDFNNILKYSIPGDIDYTQAWTAPIIKSMISRVNTYQMTINYCNDYFKHHVRYLTCTSNWKHWSQSCYWSTMGSHLAAVYVQDGVQCLWSHLAGRYMWFGRWKAASNGSFHCVRVTSEVDVSPHQSQYQESDVFALLQMSERRQQAL